jgi:nucleoside-diphosphate-sugar epimerase
MKFMKCLVTGASGFIGSSLTERLLAEGHSVRGIDCFVPYYPKEAKLANLESARRHPQFEFFEEDLAECRLEPRLDGVEWVFHQAAQAGVRASWGRYFETYLRHNVLVTQRLLEAARESGGVRKFVYASSSSVYGDAERFPTSEETLPQPVSPYGVTKLAAEHLVSLYAAGYGVPTVSLRYFTVYGPRQRPDMAFHRFIRAALNGEPLILYGDGEQTRDFTYISDVVEANLRAAERAQPGQIFNIGGGSVISVNQVIDILRGRIPGLRVERQDRQVGDARHTSADISRARQCLDYVPRVSMQEGLLREVEWLECRAK